MAKEHNVLFIPCFNDAFVPSLFEQLMSLERYGGMPRYANDRVARGKAMFSTPSEDGLLVAHGAEELGAPHWHFPVSVVIYTTTMIKDHMCQHHVMLGKVPVWFVTRDQGVTHNDAFLDVFDLPYADTFTRVLFLAVNCIWVRPVAPLWRQCLPDTVTALEVGRESFSPALFLCPRSPVMVDLFRATKAEVTHPAYTHMRFVTLALRRRCVSLGNLSKLVLYNLPRPSYLHAYTVWLVVCGM